MDLTMYERLTENKYKKMESDLEIWGGSGWAKLNYKLFEKFNLEELKKVSVFSFNEWLIFIFGKNEDKKMVYNSPNSRGVYLKGRPELKGKYRLTDYEIDENNNKVYLKFRKNLEKTER